MPSTLEIYDQAGMHALFMAMSAMRKRAHSSEDVGAPDTPPPPPPPPPPSPCPGAEW